MAERPVSTQGKRPPFLIILLLFAIPVAGFFVYYQNRLINGEDKNTAVKPLRDSEAQMTQVKLIRDKWQTWATAHKADLIALKHSSADNQAAYHKVFDAFPIAITPETGLTLEDLKAASAEDPTHKHPKWEWLMKQKSLLSAQGMAASMAKKETDAFKESMEEDRKTRDCRILKSINGGLVNLYLWSSGRVTEGEREKKEVGGAKMGGIMVLTGAVNHKETLPAFDFVK